MNRKELTNPEEIGRIIDSLRDKESYFGVEVHEGEHDEYGHVVVIKSGSGVEPPFALIVSDGVRFIE